MIMLELMVPLAAGGTRLQENLNTDNTKNGVAVVKLHHTLGPAAALINTSLPREHIYSGLLLWESCGG